VLDGDDIVISTGEATVKARNIERDPRVSVVVDDDAPPYAFVSVEGVAEISRDRDEMRRFGTQLGARYGAPGFEEYASGPDRILIRIHAKRVVAQDNLAG
jgi:PPOX class probable F420-dependent enzyme